MMNGSKAENQDHTFLNTSPPKRVPGKQTLHSLKDGEQEKPRLNQMLEINGFVGNKHLLLSMLLKLSLGDTHRGRW